LSQESGTAAPISKHSSRQLVQSFTRNRNLDDIRGSRIDLKRRSPVTEGINQPERIVERGHSEPGEELNSQARVRIDPFVPN